MNGFNNSQPASSKNVRNAIIALGAAIALVIVGTIIFLGIPLGTETEDVAEREFYRAVPEGIEVSFELETVRVLEGDHERGILTEVEMQARINGAPTTDPETGAVSVPVIFDTTSDAKVPATLVLGMDEDVILTLLVTNGELGATQEWRTRPVSEIAPLLHEGDPLMVRVYVDQPPQDSAFVCDAECEEGLQEIRDAYTQNSLIRTAVQTGEVPPTNLTIRAVSALTVYVEG